MGTRIALVASNLEYGGAQRQIVDLANALDTEGVQVYVISLSDCVPLGQRLLDKRRLLIVKKQARFDIFVVFRLARLISRLKIQVAHGFLFDAEIATRLAGRIAKVPIVIGSERNSDYHISMLKKAVYRLTRNMRQACIANSWAGAKFNAQQLGYDLSHYKVVYNGVDVSRFKIQGKDLCKHRLGLDPGRSYIGMVGSFKRQKNHLQFIRCAARLAEEFPNHDFLIAGDILENGRRHSREIREEVEREIDRLRLNERVKLLGNIDRIEEFYPACLVTVLPSFHEGLPNVVLESFACGVPVVVSDVSDNRLIVQHGSGGCVFPVNDDSQLITGVRKLLLMEKPNSAARVLRRLAEEKYSNAVFAKNMLVSYLNLLQRVTRTECDA